MAHIEDRWKLKNGTTRVFRDRGRPSRRWRARYVGPDMRERSRTFARRPDAEAWLAEQQAAIRGGAWTDPDRGRTRFAEVARSWLASNPNKRPTTRARDETVIRTHLDPVIGATAIDQLRPSHVRGVVDRMTQRGLAPKTVRTNYGVLRAIITWAVEDDLIARSPCRGVRLPADRVKVQRPVAGAEDILRLADEVGPKWRCAVLLGALGLRRAEVFGLRVGSIDFLRRTLTVERTLGEINGKIVEGTGKTEASVRTISVPQSVLDELSVHLARTGRRGPDDLVFQAPRGGPVRATNFRLRVYDPAVRRAGLDGLSFHRLRHSAGHIMREMGVPIEVIQKRLGHRSIRTTADVYGSLPESIDRGVANQLDAILSSLPSDASADSHGAFDPRSRGWAP